MTISLRPRASLFHAEGGWFSANWHFSFDRYWDEANMGLGDLRVFNDDRLIPGAAWPMHPHRDSAGMEHSERNGSKTEPMRFIQMWILPARRSLEPSVEQRSFGAESRRNILKPVLVPAAGYGADGAPSAADAVTVHQDAAVYASLLDPGASTSHRFRRG